MTSAPRILAFAGSLRQDSFNKKLVRIAAAGAEEAGARVTLIDLKDYPMPIYDGDIEAAEGFSQNVRTMRTLFREHDGLLISAPEYNSSISGALKNTIDWVSRPEDGYPPLDCFAGKAAALMSAAGGGLGGMRCLPHVRAILQNIQVIVLPRMVGVPAAHEAFKPDGSLKDGKKQDEVRRLGRELTDVLRKLLA